MNPTLVIMAAGMGSRYGGLKQMDPVGPSGETLLEYSIYDAIQAGFAKVVFVIRRDFEAEFRQQIGNRFSGKIEVHYAFQSINDLPKGFTVPEGRTKPWGTGQAVLACKGLVNEPFCVQNADDFYGAEAYRVMAAALSGLNDGESCMVGYRLEKTLSPHGAVSRGICESRGGYLTRITERLRIEVNDAGVIQFTENNSATNMNGDEICSMNFWGFTPSFFDTLEHKFIEFLRTKGDELTSEWYIPDIITGMMESGKIRVKILNCSSSWFGITYPEDRPGVAAALQSMHDSGQYPPGLTP